MTPTKPLRRAGGRWRILVHQPGGKSHHVQSDAAFGTLPAAVLGEESRKRLDDLRAEHSTMTVLAGTEFDELVVGRWIHVEQMDVGRWWMAIGGLVVWVQVDRDGRPTAVDWYEPGTYDEPVPGVVYQGRSQPVEVVPWDDGTAGWRCRCGRFAGPYGSRETAQARGDEHADKCDKVERG